MKIVPEVLPVAGNRPGYCCSAQSISCEAVSVADTCGCCAARSGDKAVVVSAASPPPPQETSSAASAAAAIILMVRMAILLESCADSGRQLWRKNGSPPKQAP